MESHKCKYETDIALMKQSIDHIEKNIGDVRDSLLGNGKLGLKTEIELTKGSLSRLYWIIGLSIFAIAMDIVVGLLTK